MLGTPSQSPTTPAIYSTLLPLKCVSVLAESVSMYADPHHSQICAQPKVTSFLDISGNFSVAMATTQPSNASEWQLYRVLQRANLLQYYDTFIAQGEWSKRLSVNNLHIICISHFRLHSCLFPKPTARVSSFWVWLIHIFIHMNKKDGNFVHLWIWCHNMFQVHLKWRLESTAWNFAKVLFWYPIYFGTKRINSFFWTNNVIVNILDLFLLNEEHFAEISYVDIQICYSLDSGISYVVLH